MLQGIWHIAEALYAVTANVVDASANDGGTLVVAVHVTGGAQLLGRLYAMLPLSAELLLPDVPAVLCCQLNQQHSVAALEATTSWLFVCRWMIPPSTAWL